MTILVGMVGSDGILLAADQRQTRLACSEQRFDDHADICKITHLEKHKVAFARVGDEASKAVGTRLAMDLDVGEFDASIGLWLEDIASQTMKEECEKAKNRKRTFSEELERSLLVVFYGDQMQEPQLWKLRVSPPYPAAERITGIVVSGADGNRARFFDTYYWRNPISNLIFLASHIVLTAHRIDPVMIRGLDVALFKEHQCRFLNEQEKQSLGEKSQELDGLIRERLYR